MGRRSLTLLLLLAALAGAQKESFEVASVKPGDPSDRRMMINIAPGRFRTVNVPVILLVRLAWEVQDFQIAGLPDWAKTERFNIEAKWADPADEDPVKMTEERRNVFQKRLHLRLQSLLEDRFALKAHRETKDMPVYELIVAKNGPKVRLASQQTDSKERGMIRMARGELAGTAVRIESLVQELSTQIGRTVIDKTGLKAEYDFSLRWMPESRQMNSMAPPPGAQPPGVADITGGDATGPSLTTAVQEQLGLKLESARAPVEVIVIDHVEKPSAN
jgi:uncharacterized protein (TIGR03435 family)